MSLNIKYFDAHCDTIQLTDFENPLDSERLYDFKGHISLSKLRFFRPCGQFFALFGGGKDKSEDKSPEFDKQYKNFVGEIQNNPLTIAHCKSSDDILCAFAENKVAALLSIEGAELVKCCIEGLDKAYNLGVRSIMPVWNHSNRLCGSNAENPEQGLSEDGHIFIRHAFELGMLVDVSHMSDKGFYDVYEIACDMGRPVMASHSNSRSICPHMRNLTDDMFKKIIETGGIAGINMYTAFLTQESTCTISDVIRHIDHFLSLGGEHNISLGCDFDGCDSLPAQIKSVSDIQKLYYNLILHGYSKKLIDNIFCNNLTNLVLCTI